MWKGEIENNICLCCITELLLKSNEEAGTGALAYDPSIWEVRWENLKFKVSLDYKMGLSQKNKNEKSNEVTSHTETTSAYY
jgi:hypothetical protein